MKRDAKLRMGRKADTPKATTRPRGRYSRNPVKAAAMRTNANSPAIICPRSDFLMSLAIRQLIHLEAMLLRLGCQIKRRLSDLRIYLIVCADQLRRRIRPLVDLDAPPDPFSGDAANVGTPTCGAWQANRGVVWAFQKHQLAYRSHLLIMQFVRLLVHLDARSAEPGSRCLLARQSRSFRRVAEWFPYQAIVCTCVWSHHDQDFAGE